MCDCYETQCRYCGRAIPIHIGDFSTSRQAVKAFCWDCGEAMLEHLQGSGISRGEINVVYKQVAQEIIGQAPPHIVFVDWTKEGKPVWFVVDMPHGVHLNGEPDA